jgi:hypothetical protein
LFLIESSIVVGVRCLFPSVREGALKRPRPHHYASA